MRSRGSAGVVVLFLLALSPFDAGAADPAREQALADLRARFPGVRALDPGETVALYGVPMTVAETTEEAATQWLVDHGTALGVRLADLELYYETPAGFGKFVAYAYRQRMHGLPVEESRVRILVRGAAPCQVVYAASAAVGAFSGEASPVPAVSAAGALRTVQNLAEYRTLDSWSSPIAAWLPPTPERPATRLVWKFHGRSANRAEPRAFTFFVDALTGDLLRARDEIVHADADGLVTGLATPGLEPDVAANPPVEVALAGLLVGVGSADSTYTDADGAYLLTDLPETVQSLQAELTGASSIVFSVLGSDEVLTETILPPATVDFVFNESESEYTTAQVNGFVHAEATHDFYKERNPGYDGLDTRLACYVNIDSACNAYFDPIDLSINFFAAGTAVFPGVTLDCNNTAFATVITHEYGHFILNQLGVPQGAFGEGFADTLSILRFDNPIIGEDFYTDGSAVRDIAGANQQYPCGGEIHTCGQVLAGVFWDLKLAFEETFGTAAGLANAQQLFVDWSAITTGGSGTDSAYPTTAVEVLTVDDDDGVIENGTPNRADICAAFEAHGIDCPALDTIGFEFPDGIPVTLAPDGSTTFPVLVVAIEETPEDGTGLLYYSTNGSGFLSLELTPTGTNEYLAEIPVDACGDRVEFYFGALDPFGDEVFSPRSAPDVVHAAIVATSVEAGFSDDFETGLGWTVGDSVVADTAATGIWTRVDPVGTAAQPDNDRTPDPGTMCFVTGQGTVGGGLGDNDIDGGKTTLLSPVLDLSADGEYTISYWRWYSNDTGAAPNADVFEVEISDDDGAAGSWVTVETVGPGPSADTTGGWIEHSFRPGDFIAPTSEVRVRFIAEDAGAGSLVEAAVDDFVVRYFACGESPPEFARGDCNQSGGRDISDPIFLLGYLFGDGSVTVECDDACDGGDDGVLGLADVFSLLDHLFAGETIPAPFPGCGADETADDLDCAAPSPACP